VPGARDAPAYRPSMANAGKCSCIAGIPAIHGHKKKPSDLLDLRVLDEAPGSDLLSHGLSHTTIGAGAFHFRVRDGIGWDHAAVSAREAVEAQVAVKRLGLHRVGT
jgi:hypothetical protein